MSLFSMVHVSNIKPGDYSEIPKSSLLIKSILVVLIVSKFSFAASVSLGKGNARLCSEAISFALRDAVYHYKTTKSSVLSVEQLAAKISLTNYLNSDLNKLIAIQEIDSVKSEIGCAIIARVTFDSVRINRYISKYEGWDDHRASFLPLQREALSSRSAGLKQANELLAQFIQREFRSALDVSVSKTSSFSGDAQIEVTNVQINSNDKFDDFLRSVRALLDEMVDRYEYAAQVEFTTGVNHNGFIITNTRYKKYYGLDLPYDTLDRRGINIGYKLSRDISRKSQKLDLLYSIQIKRWEGIGLAIFDETGKDCDGQDSTHSYCIASRWNTMVTAKRDAAPDILVTNYGVDFDFQKSGKRIQEFPSDINRLGAGTLYSSCFGASGTYDQCFWSIPAYASGGDAEELNYWRERVLRKLTVAKSTK